MPPLRPLASFAGLLLALVSLRAHAEDMVAPDVAAKTLLRALAYDRSLAPRDGTLVIAVVVKPSADGGDGAAFEAAVKALGDVTVQNAHVKLVRLEVGSASEVDARLSEANPQVVYVAKGFDGDGAKVQASAQKQSALTLYRWPGYGDFFAVGVVPREGKSKIVVRLGAAKAAGAVLDSQLLRLAQVLD